MNFSENKLIAIVALGKKRSGKAFSQDDLVVFSILANQSALAIENAIFYEESKRTQEQLFKAEKMATIGTMADGLSHQINNRLHAMGFIAGDAIDTINIKQQENISEDVKKVLDDVKYSLKRIEENVKQGGEIVSGLLKYTRKGETGMETVDLKPASVYRMANGGFAEELKNLELNPRDYTRVTGQIETRIQPDLFNEYNISFPLTAVLLKTGSQAFRQMLKKRGFLLSEVAD